MVDFTLSTVNVPCSYVRVMSADVTRTVGWSYNSIGGEKRTGVKGIWLRSLWLAAAITLMQNPVGLRDEGFLDNQHNNTWLYGGFQPVGSWGEGNYTSIINGTALALNADLHLVLERKTSD